MKEKYWNEGLDLKRFLLLYVKNIWVVFLATVIGVLAGGLLYYGVISLGDSADKYVVESDYYITFNYNEYTNATDYFNAYTWDGILRTDPLVDTALELLPDNYTKDMILNAVTGEMRGDYRILTVLIEGETPEMAKEITDAYIESLKVFPPKAQMLDTVEMWAVREPYLADKYTRDKNAMFLGGLIGLLLSAFALAMKYLLKDSVYVETDFTKKFPIPFLGTVTNKKDARFMNELTDNFKYICKGEKYLAVDVTGRENVCFKAVKEACPGLAEAVSLNEEGFEKLRACDGAVLCIPFGKTSGKLLEKVVLQLQKQDCKIAGAVITDGKDLFLKAYYK